jgi:dTDP-4-dehydrorhamnose reductase
MIKTRIALIGAGGQLATDLVLALGSNVRVLSHREIEIEDPASIAGALDGVADVVINTAAYNLVDKAESEPERAFAVNAQGVENLATWCAARGLKLVHFSTDYVLGGDPAEARPLDENTRPCPASIYAESKLAGEEAIRRVCRNHLIIRTCGLYGLAATKAKGNFIETMLRLGQTRPEISVVDDQHCTPSYTVDVAQATIELINAHASGTFHVTNAGATTWKQLAEEVFRVAGLPMQVKPITSAEYGAQARRPAWSVLNCGRMERLLGRSMPDWKNAVQRYLASRSESLAKPQ